jgi:hypothetical protein
MFLKDAFSLNKKVNYYQDDQMGEFSPIWRLLTWVVILNMTKVAQIFVPHTFLHGERYVLILTKNLFGLHFGRFFHKPI